MAAHLQGQRADFLPERVIVLFKNGGQFFVAFNPFVIVAVAQLFTGHAGREAGQRAQGALNEVQAGVGARAGFIPFHQDGAAHGGLDDGGVHVAAGEVQLVPLVVRREILLGIGGAAQGRAGEGNEPAEAVVLAGQVHVLGDGAEAVRGVDVAIALGVVVGSPGAGAAVHLLHLAAQFVDVGGFPVQQVADDALAHHVQVHEFFTSVVDVFHHHAVLPGFLGGIDDFPEFLDGDGHGDFHKGVGAHFHHVAGDAAVPFPAGADDDGVRLDFLHHALVVFRAVRENGRALARLLFHQRRVAFRPVLVQVADADDFRAFNDGHLAHVHGAAFTYADEGHAHLVQLGGPEAAHVDGAGLARGPRGHGTDVVRVRNDDLFGSQGSYFLGVGEGTGSQGASSQTQGLKETTA